MFINTLSPAEQTTSDATTRALVAAEEQGITETDELIKLLWQVGVEASAHKGEYFDGIDRIEVYGDGRKLVFYIDGYLDQIIKL